MQEFDLNRSPKRHPFLSVILILAVVALGFIIVGPFLGFFLSLPFYPGGIEDFMTALADPLNDPNLKIPMYIMQACATVVGLILVPAWLMRKDNTSLAEFFRGQSFAAVPVLITAFIVIVFMAVNSVFVEWNANFHFPEFARGFENWARARENAAAELTEYLTKFASPAELFIALLVIAVLPAIGEEIVFRGLIQNELYRGTKNIHAAIWIAAILFSAIHVQFFGFVPRVLLGALFGYLYYWSGNLTLAIIAHFVNNGISVVAMYFYQQGAFEFDLESPESAPASVVMISAALTAGLLYYFYKYFQQHKPSTPFP